MKTFPTGIFFKVNPKAPRWILGKISIKKDEFAEWLSQQEGEWINFSVNEKKNEPNAYYVELDTWKPNQVSNQQIEEKHGFERHEYDPMTSPDDNGVSIDTSAIPF